MNKYEVLKHYWNYDHFRPLQEDIIDSVLSGQDTLALMPTGGGKSICFQVPALMQDGVCLVISPLIALMKDQVSRLRQLNIPAEAIYTGMKSSTVSRILDNCIFGKNIKLLYISPERLQSPVFQERIKKINVSFIAVDEAHCISQWGYDFRPAYLKIAEIKEYLSNPVPFLALTATATPKVKVDIQEKLLFPNQNVYQKSFKRKNLSYSVQYTENKIEKLFHILKHVPGTVIVYVRSRKMTKKIAIELRKKHISADFYHAGLSPKLRDKKQEYWTKGKTQVMVCTNAFGMGIDKSDVRLVVHISPTESLEAYYQEAGRAGRDERRAYGVLLYNEADISNIQQQFENSFPSLEVIRRTYQALGNFYQLAIGSGEGQSFDFDLIKICKTFNIKPILSFNAIKILVQNHFISLNHAVFLPSRFLFTVSKQELYKFEVANRQLDPYIKAILRTYGGVFDDFVDINETEIARHLRTTRQYVEKALHQLQKHDVAQYEPRTDQPKITFTNRRIVADKLTINRQLFNQRKKVKQQNIQSVIDYVKDNKSCRSQQLVRYFGELDGTLCGVCDVCIAEKKLAKKEALIQEITGWISQKIGSQKMSVEDLLEEKTVFKQQEMLYAIRWMLDNNLLIKDEKNQLSIEIL